MKITNKLGLPGPVYRAVLNDPYTRGKADISVTGLLSPPRIRALLEKHGDEMEEDASDRIFALMGKIGHGILETAADSGIVEKRFFIKRNGWTLSGQCDYIPEEKKLIDYKFCSIWVFKDGIKPEWEQQTNIYRLMAAESGVEIDEINIVAIFRDWSKMEVTRNEDYPKHQVNVFRVPIWDQMKTEAFISERIALHKAAMADLPLCTEEDKWQRDPKWAVMKGENKRATKVYSTEEEALAHAEGDPKLKVVYRPSEPIRCNHYCPVNSFCDQYKFEKDNG